MPALFNTEKVSELVEKLQKPVFSAKDCGLTYRALHHYQKVGLLDSKETQKSWRKFSSIELIWIRVIMELREMGVSLDKLNITKKRIFQEGSQGSIDRAQFINNSFDQEIALSLHSKYDLYLILFSDFSYTFHDSHTQKQWYLKPYRDVANISIPLSGSIKEVWSRLKEINEIE